MIDHDWPAQPYEPSQPAQGSFVLPIKSKRPIRIVNDDVLMFARCYRGEKFHALLCDPPYHLTSITKRFGKTGSAPAKHGKDGAFSRAARGFMGKQWDGGDIAFNPYTWSVLADLLYPGAFGMAFASSRGWHRLAVAIEDAGLIIHPSIFGWAFGSGFPKATRIDTQLDKQANVERPTIGVGSRGKTANAYGTYPSEQSGRFPVTAPVSDLAKVWEGHRYGLQALKPALEPIIVFQKPYEGRPIDCITNTGAGAFNIDAGRIGTSADAPQREGAKNNKNVYQSFVSEGGKVYDMGRWPANLVTVNSPDDVDYFYNSDWHYEVAEQLADANPVRYEAKASPEEREKGLHAKPTIVNITDGRQVPLEYQDKYNAAISPRKNPHPTVKPIALIEHLARLLLPPPAYASRRILIPFAGSGSEVIGAYQAGWECVVGIERELEYAEIARTRLDYYMSVEGRQMPLFA
jgi:hypothetical protein